MMDTGRGDAQMVGNFRFGEIARRQVCSQAVAKVEWVAADARARVKVGQVNEVATWPGNERRQQSRSI